jgi:glycosyltransferase involved in cell wall biosynthesis
VVEIIIATKMRPEGDTGVQTHFRTFLRWLNDQGNTASLLTPYSMPKWMVYPVFAVRMLIDRLSGTASVWWYRHWHTVFLQMALRKKLANGAPCVVYTQCPLSARAAMRVRSSDRQKVVLVVHFNVSQADEWAGKGAISENGHYAKMIRKLEMDTLPRLDGLVYVSDFMRRVLLDRNPAISRVPYAVVPNFVKDPGVPQANRETDGDLVIVGTLEPRKNQGYALDILAAAEAQGVLLNLTVAGDGPDKEKLESQAVKLGIRDRVRFLGFVRNAAELFARHKACLHTARIENLPLTLIEAFSRGIPVFAPAVGGVPEVVSDGVDGRLLPLDTPEAAAKIILEWFADGGSPLVSAGRKARAAFLDRFENDVAASRLRSFLAEVAQS